ncbi:LamG-like jellyroll fold domain-containing protein [Paractinoplanes rhizophilus]|uniref:LamG-like jellyroll fold domain-containing protein n=1 Tax=Paractinoplanes rhizophilus TaxID=1416877 RepID=A0ABW2I532_9ACTN
MRWASAQSPIGGLPKQLQGERPQHGGYVGAAATASSGGAGRAPGKTPEGGLEPYEPYDPSTKTIKIAGKARGFVAETSKRDAVSSSAAMDEYKNADGSTTQVFTSGVTNFKSGAAWQKIDPTLVEDGSSRWETKASSLKVSLAGKTGEVASNATASTTPAGVPSATPDAVPGATPDSTMPSAIPSTTPSANADTAPSEPVASVKLPSGDSVGYELAEASAATASVAGPTATYSGVLPGIDLQLRTSTAGVKQILVLHSPQSPNEWTFPLHLNGLSPRMTTDGSLELVDDARKARAWFPHGSMSDSKVDPDSGDFATSSAVTMSLTTTAAGTPALRVVADRKWLDDPARVYPVRVSGALTANRAGSAYVDNDAVTGPGEQAGDDLQIGTYDGGKTKARSYLNFGDVGTRAKGTTVTSASLRLHLTYAKCGADQSFSVFPQTPATSAAALSATAYPGPAVAAEPIGSLTVSDPAAACANSAADPAAGTDVTVPLDVAAFNDGTIDTGNFGVALAASDTDTSAYKVFTSEQAASGEYAPALMLTTAANVAPQVDTRYPGNNAIVETLTPQLVTRAHDPDKSPNTGLTYSYGVYNSAGSLVIASGTISTPTWQVPAGKLAWNSTYYYAVAVGDHTSTAAPTAFYAFSTPVPQPRLTSDLAQNPGVGFDPNNGNYTTSATDASVAGIGPELEISRSYNSLDTRRSGAFGQGWSSILDTRATQKLDAAGAVRTVVVTYPNGSEVAFGRNNDGTFTPPSGRYATFTAQTSGSTVTGYTLTDKDATRYVFGRAAGSGVFQVTAIIDANGRALAFSYANSVISTVTNAAGRKLTLTWVTASSQTVGAAHVATVTTDAPVAGGSGYTWTYAYGTYDRLTTVCPPGTTTACTVYNWANWHSEYPHATLNLNPYSYWRLNDAVGSGSAESSVLANARVDNGTYHNVALGGAPSLIDSSATTAGFNGTSSNVQLPGKLVADGSYQSLSMWFKTSTPGGVLFSYSASPITAGTTTGNFTPALYIDKNGYLRGEFWQGAAAPIRSTSTVTNNAWHHVVLAGAGNTQTMYLDGVAQGSLAGTIAMFGNNGSAYEYAGAGFVGFGWPDHAYTGTTTGTATYFNGSLSDVAFYTKTLTTADVANLYWVADNSSSAIRYVKSPAGRIQSQVAVSNVTGDVTTVTDENGGVWTMGTPTIAGNSDVYSASVLGAKPFDYWRLGEIDSDVTDAVNEVAGGTASYSSVTLGASGPFADNTATQFDGSTSNVALPGSVTGDAANSVGVWFNTTATGKVIYGAQAGALGESTAPGMPALWISADGKLRGLAPSTTPTGPLRLGIAGKCLDNFNQSTTDGNKIDIWTCNNGKAQTWTAYADGTIRIGGKCLDIKGGAAATANGALIDLWTCNNGLNQKWQPYNGGLRNPNSGKCLADPAASTTDGTQLMIWTCNGGAEQAWTMSLASAQAVNDGKWHFAMLTNGTTNQSLYIDGVASTWAVGTVPLTPGNQPHAYLGAGFTGAGWAGLPANTTTYFNGKLAEAAFYDAELTSDQVAAQWDASKQTVGQATTLVDNTVTTITMPVKTVTVIDPGGKTLSYAYDLLNNRQIAETDTLGNTTRYGYDVGGFSNLVYDPTGVWTQATQDARGNTIKRVTCQDQSVLRCSTSYFEYYLNASNPVDPRNDVMTASRDARSISNTDNTYKTSYSYDAKGNPQSTADALGRIAAMSFTDGTTVAAADSGLAPPGLPYLAVNPAGGKQQISYNANGDVARTVSPSGEVTTFTYDKLGRKLTETTMTSTFPNGRTTSFAYDGQGRLLTQTDPPVTNRVTGAVHTAVTTNVYDADGNITLRTATDATGGDVARTQTVAYNAYGQKESQTDAVGKTTSFTYNQYGQVVTETDSDGGVTGFETDAEGNVLTETMKGWTGDPNNPSSPADLVTKTNTYDPNGRLASTTDAMGWTTAYKYTDDGLTAQIIRTDKPLKDDGTPADGATTFIQAQNTYDPAGNLTQQVTNNGATTTTIGYDAANRPDVTTLDPGGLNRVTRNVYSPDDKVVSTTQAVGAGNPLSITDHQYDAEGRLRAEIAYNGDPATTPVARWKLDQTTGTTAVDSAGNSSAPTTNITWSASAPPGHTGSANFPDSTSARIATDGPVLDTGRPYTVSAWVYLTDTNYNRAAVSQDGETQSAFMLGYAGYTTNRWRMLISKDGSNTVDVTSTAVPALNTWTHLAAVFDGTKATLYVNGTAQGSAPTTSINTNGPLVLGAGKWAGGPSDAWPGQVADVLLYQRPLTGTQVSAVYNGTAPVPGAGVTRVSSNLDESGLATRTTDPRGNATDISYDEAERPAVSTGAPVTVETLSGAVVARPVSYTGYDTFGDPTETVDSNGNQTTFVYDRAGRVYETHRPPYTAPGATTISPVSSVTYDALGQTTSTTDELGNTTRYSYDQLGRVSKAVAPNDGVTTMSYDLNGNPTSITGPTGARAETTYDYLGRELTSTRLVRQTSEANTTTYAYDPAGRLKSATSPTGVSQSYTYNAAGEQVASVDGAGQTTRTDYDGLGRPTKMTQPGGAYRTTAYDMLSRPSGTAAYEPNGTQLTTSSQTFDAAGNVLTSTDGRGSVTSYTYDPTGLVMSERQPTSATTSVLTSFGYDLNGNRTRFTDGRGNAFWTTYNAFNMAESTIEPVTASYSAPSDRTWTSTYDAAGQIVGIAAPGGVTLTYAYDSMGALISEAGAGAAASTATRTYGYDLAGRMTSFAVPGGTNEITYDDRSLPTGIGGPSGTSSFAWTRDGLMKSRTDTAGTTSYTYDTADRLATLTNPTAGTSLAYAYDADSAVKSITYGGAGNVRTFTYDGLKRPTGDELKTASGTSIAKIAYGWDANSNETSKTTTNFGSTTTANTYGYDLADRLISWSDGTTTTAYTYDASGNRTGNGSTTYTYDARNRLVGDSTGAGYVYTPRGTVSQTTNGATIETTVSDAFDQVASQSAGGNTSAYTYDALGRALQTGFSYTGTGNDLAADAGSTYVRDPDNDVVGTTSGGTSCLVWTDLHDDVVGQFTATGTTLTGSTVYDPLGTVKTSTGMLGNLGYQSEWTDSLTKRVNMSARWYNPGTGQFDSRDTAANTPIPDSINANQYAYANANPLTGTDPSGHGLWSKITHGISSIASRGYSYAAQAVSTAYSAGSYAYHRLSSYAYAGLSAGLGYVAAKANKLGAKSVAKLANKGRAKATKKSQQHARQAKRAHQDFERKGKALKQRTARVVRKATKVVKDAHKKVVKAKVKNPSAVERFLETIGEDAWKTVTGSGPLCLLDGGTKGCWNKAMDIALAANSAKWRGLDVPKCQFTFKCGDLWNDLKTPFKEMNCDKGVSAECAGHIAFFAIMEVLTDGVGGATRVEANAAKAAGAGATGFRVAARGAAEDATAVAARAARPRSPLIEGIEAGARCSFAPATPVLMADGTRKPIIDVVVGDKVVATDPQSGETSGKAVMALHDNLDIDLADVTVADRSGHHSVVHTTQNHRFWDASTEKWTRADQLHPGDRLTTPNGTTATIVTVHSFAGSQHMLNLTIADIHTYYVLAGNAPVLVHNDDGIYSWPNTDGPIPQRGQTALYAQFDQRSGEFLKWGVWTNTTGNYSRYTQKYLRERKIQTTVLQNFDSKAEAHAVERDLVARAPGPHNLEQYAGSKSVGEDPLDIIRNFGYRGGPAC